MEVGLAAAIRADPLAQGCAGSVPRSGGACSDGLIRRRGQRSDESLRRWTQARARIARETGRSIAKAARRLETDATAPKIMTAVARTVRHAFVAAPARPISRLPRERSLPA